MQRWRTNVSHSTDSSLLTFFGSTMLALVVAGIFAVAETALPTRALLFS